MSTTTFQQSDPKIIARARASYESSVAHSQILFPEGPGRHYPTWDELLTMAVTIEGVFDAVRGWYFGAKREMEQL